jgi:YVTN family beta-propeller protein
MKKNFLKLKHLAIVAALFAMPLAAKSVRVYVTNHAGISISVIDPAKNKVVDQIRGIEVPEAVDVSPDGSKVYISEGVEDVLTVLDRKTSKVIKKIPITGHANDLAATPDGKWVLVCIGQVPGGLDVIDTSTLEIHKTIPSETRLHDIAVSANSKYAVATSPNGKFVRVFDLTTDQAAWEVKFDQGTLVPTIENGPDGSPKRIFVQLTGTDGFAVIDFEKKQEAARVTFPADEPKIKTNGPPSHGIGVAPDGKMLWVISGAYDAVFAYSLPDLKPMGRVHLPKIEIPGKDAISGVPDWLAFTPDSKTVYVANEGDRTVSAIDAKTMKAVARIPVGEAPGRMNTGVLP